ncbi:hypothetical protein METBIDRAFT_229670 [Metschnikowia bicuspidata var. bicuspidata NRRL YB-4993]|uniref:BSD domain-containing protein n=1 Tax=Metschnikowia bicuspidata var. bicuspidata NRRL YB-4993 TaxID=869754 RepID=A0A1A0HB13_9ASCO|nr:hypothetical protein METBIDRAFT_229670 [Metschnikowia bicuspidata var. bicuspidata NRRL YB-4993]OBA21201.1 hypothetical protein METBIDRAFT_229670 [Metschnikowia bicuspidata var. bicuspidata NRRL YB-4993]
MTLGAVPNIINMDLTEPLGTHEDKQKNSSLNNKDISQHELTTVTRLENDIEDVYTLIESKIATFWRSATRNVHESQEKIIGKSQDNLDQKPNHGKSTAQYIPSKAETLGNTDSDHPVRSVGPKIDLSSISVLANRALDELDSKLEIVEQKAGNFMSSLTSFFSGSDLSDTQDLHDRHKKNASALPILPGNAYGSSRYDMELFKLHTTPDAFMNASFEEEAELSDFLVDAKTQEISSLLCKYLGTLEKLMNDLVPTQLTYEKFWFRYFKQESKLRAGEQARKMLLSQSSVGDSLLGMKENSGHSERKEECVERKSSMERVRNLYDEVNQDDDDEDFTWDDDEEIQTSDS